MAALSRAELPEAQRPDFFVYLDELQIFTTLSLASMLSELRKYRVGLVLAQQYLSQNVIEIPDAILGNVGTILSFAWGSPMRRCWQRSLLQKSLSSTSSTRRTTRSISG